jgi:arsenate reductase (thioredoxin)
MIKLLPALAAYVADLEKDLNSLSDQRRQALEPLIAYLVDCLQRQSPILLNYICTHNSRRSHLGQIWGAVSAAVHRIPVRTYSGGTEATSFNPRAVAAIERAGFTVSDPGGTNPHYLVTFSSEAPALECFSKTFDDIFNPTQNFAAIMTCESADRACPVVLGAARISLPYRDPKVADDTPEEIARYDERCRQIATEMLFVFQHASHRR